ncbi:MAG TPA: gliding motility protein GldN [Chitinophagaceae bacterium]|nr:gliding motility protein GldN [Chitinophagaceae bacterium]
MNKSKSLMAGLLMMAGAAVAQPGGQPAVGSIGDPNASTTGGYVNSNWKPSLRKDGAIDMVEHNHYLTPWQTIREADVLWKKRVWMEIDTRQKQNLAFRYPGDEESGGGMYIEILIDAIKNGKVTAFSDDRFTTQMTANDVLSLLAQAPDTAYKERVDGTTEMIIVKHEWNPELITKYRMKEDCIFDKSLGRMVHRIIGIAPYKDIMNEDGSYRASTPLFWLHYEDLRPVNVKYEVYNPENDVYRVTWDDFFEKRMFSSYILKSTFDNVLQDDISAKKSGIDKLYESDAIKEKIFNKEHDLWVY